VEFLYIKIQILVHFGKPRNRNIWYSSRPFCVWSFCVLLAHLVHAVVIWYSFPRSGMLHQDKPGNPG
jgi:hypothetical protein